MMLSLLFFSIILFCFTCLILDFVCLCWGWRHRAGKLLPISRLVLHILCKSMTRMLLLIELPEHLNNHIQSSKAWVFLFLFLLFHSFKIQFNLVRWSQELFFVAELTTLSSEFYVRVMLGY